MEEVAMATMPGVRLSKSVYSNKKQHSSSPILLRADSFEIFDDASPASLCQSNLGKINAMMGRGHGRVGSENGVACGSMHVWIADQLGNDKASCY